MAVTCKLRNGNKINIYFNYKNVIVGGTHEVRTGLGVVGGGGGGGGWKKGRKSGGGGGGGGGGVIKKRIKTYVGRTCPIKTHLRFTIFSDKNE